jgi:hypothetical protein
VRVLDELVVLELDAGIEVDELVVVELDVEELLELLEDVVEELDVDEELSDAGSKAT